MLTPETDAQRALAEYRAKVDAKYARMKNVTLSSAKAAAEPEISRKDRWLLIDPNGDIVGVLSRREGRSAVSAFEQFYPKKRERHDAAAQGYHIEEDDENGTRFEAYVAEMKAAKE